MAKSAPTDGLSRADESPLVTSGGRPPWDYWMSEKIGDYGTFPIDHVKELNQGDLRNKRYHLDTKKWCRSFFWDAEEAALISFFRDPDKTRNAVAWDDQSDEEFEKHIEFKNQLFDLYQLIKSAQKEKVLPDFFRPQMYIEWASRVGVSISADISTEVERAERQRNYRGRPPNMFELASGHWPTEEMLASGVSEDKEVVESEDESEPKLSSQQTRYKNGLTKVLYALLLETNLSKQNPADLAKKLASRLEHRADGDPKFALPVKRIQDRLQEALDHGK